MLQKLPPIFLVLLFSLYGFGQEGGQAGPVLSFDVPSQNLLRYNRYLVHPAFSTLGPVNTYISFHHRNQWADYDNSFEVSMGSFSGKINERTGFAIGLFQQKYGVLSNFGVMANYAYGVQIADNSVLALGVNMVYYRSGINWGSVFISDPGDPALQNTENNSLIAFHPGLNLTLGSFNMGIYAENLVNFNLTDYKSYIYGNSGKILWGHVMYTLKMEMLEGSFEDGEMTTMIRARKAGEDFYPSASLMLNFPKIGWLQVGYDDFYGAAAGIGFNLTRHLSLGYTIEKGLSEVITNFGITHEFGLAYTFTPADNTPRYYSYGRRKRPVTTPRPKLTPEPEQGGAVVPTRGEKNEVVVNESIEKAAISPEGVPATGDGKKAGEEKAEEEKKQGQSAPGLQKLGDTRLTAERRKQMQDSIARVQKRTALGRQLLGNTHLTAERMQEIQDSIDRAGKREEKQLGLASQETDEEPGVTVAEEKSVPVVQEQAPDIDDLLFEAAAKQENIRTQTATLMDVEDGYYIIANVFKNEANLQKYIQTLKDKGWKAGHFKNPANDLNYVFVKKYDSWEEAINRRKQHARELNNSGVWVFRVKNANTQLARLESQLKLEADLLAEKVPQTRDSVLRRKNARGLPLAVGEIKSGVKNTYIPVDIIESVPVFPDCENLRNNEERKACLANGIDKIIQRRFRASVATGLGLSGIQGIYVEFKVGADGEVSVLRIRAPHKRLEDEARRVIGHIPKMQPGRQGNTPVDVMYSKAIIIKIE